MPPCKPRSVAVMGRSQNACATCVLRRGRASRCDSPPSRAFSRQRRTTSALDIAQASAIEALDPASLHADDPPLSAPPPLGVLHRRRLRARLRRRPAAPTSNPVSASAAADDPYLWLEDIHGEKPLEWVHARERGDREGVRRRRPSSRRRAQRILEVLDSEARIPYVQKIGAHYYNFWQDQRIRSASGGARRWPNTASRTRSGRPCSISTRCPATEGKRWVWHGADCLKPGYQRCLLSLSPGGGDADVVREFDLGDEGVRQGWLRSCPKRRTRSTGSIATASTSAPISGRAR